MSSLEAHKMKPRPKYWRSLDELADTAEFRTFVEKEFPDFAGELLEHPNRRSFIKLMGASAALAGLTACRWPKEKVVPYARQPEGRLPGVPAYYATNWELGGHGIGMVVTSFDGRPIKIEGNSEHPASLGGASAWMQALVLEMYDPDRSQFPLKAGSGAGWDEFDAAFRALAAELKSRRGAGLAILSEATNSPTIDALRKQLLAAMPEARWHEYEPLSRDNERAGTKLVFGRAMRPLPRVDAADLIVSLDSDFMFEHPAALRLARHYASRRRAEDGTMSRLYVLESSYTVTGAAADHRHALSNHEIGTVALALAGQGSVSGEAAAMAEMLGKELEQHRGKGIVIAGPHQPAAVHAAVAMINARYGNAGSTVVYAADPNQERAAHVDSIQALTSAMSAGSLEMLLILGGNPIYNAPADLQFGAALGKVKNSIHLSLYNDETSKVCGWHVPRAHLLESWGDTRGWGGAIGITQPLIEPLYGGKTPAELLALLLGAAVVKGHDLVRATHAHLDDKAWRHALHDGVVADSMFATASPTPAASTLTLEGSAPSTTALDVVFTVDNSVHDGRFANSAWLQENPDPLTKLVWDNAALISPATAEALGIKHGELVTISAGGKQIEAAVYTMPGQAKNVVSIALGYGRNVDWRIASSAVGFNAYPLRTSGAMWVAHGATVKSTGRSYELVSTQDHWAIDKIGREEIQRRVPELAREATLAEFKQNPKFAKEGEVALFNLWDEQHPYEGRKWGMAIDLTACIGCGACTVACQAENNISVVGKDQVRRGREMHWIRLDRYFMGDPETAAVTFQPVTCMHCENAPCEQVCPVAATVHDSEGLNVMVYNRCIGTRYCSNNCPYKVRRFNYYNWHLFNQKFQDNPLQAMVYNPEVSVRARGVMEKCSYCVQRINRVKIETRNEKLPIKDGTIVSACQQTCPTQAITFGDLADPESRVRKLQSSDRSYAMLQELNVRPRTQYLARLKNPAGEAGKAHSPEGHA